MINNTREHQYAFGISLQQEATKNFGKTLLFAAALIMSHLLGIEPSEAETLGLKFTTPDPIILHGSLALIFVHYLFRLVSFSERGASLFHLRSEAAQMRYYVRILRRQSRGKKTPQQIKKSAKAHIVFYQVLMSPYWVAVTILLVVAFIVAVIDVYQLTDYVVDHSEALADLFGYEIDNTVAEVNGAAVTPSG